MLLSAIVLAVIVGYARGGRLRRLERIELRAEGLMMGALLVQLAIPMVAQRLHLPSGLALSLWLATYALLLLALWMNRDRIALVIAGAGVFLNALVIALNGGMPVLANALRFISPGEKVGSSAFAGDPLHHLAAAGTRLVWLGDVIPVPLPSLLGGVMSVGDVLLMIGVFWLVRDGMLYAGKRRISR